MSNILTKAIYSLDKATAKYCRVTCFGLNYKVSLNDLVYKKMIINALEFDDDYSNTLYTTSERNYLLNKVSTPIGGSYSTGCSAC